MSQLFPNIFPQDFFAPVFAEWILEPDFRRDVRCEQIEQLLN
jgi:hypothetical protein